MTSCGNYNRCSAAFRRQMSRSFTYDAGGEKIRAPRETTMISRLAVVESSRIGAGAHIAEFAVIRAGAELGRDVVVHPHAVVNAGVIIGDNVEIFSGAVIGKEPKGAGALARSPVFERRVVMGAGCSIGPHAVVYYDVEIGD